MTKDVLLPDLGEGIDLVDVSEVLVSVGDKVAVDDPVIVLESDKATMEVPTTESGVISKLYVKDGDQIKAGQQIVAVDVQAGGRDEKKVSTTKKAKVDQPQEEAETTPVGKKFEKSAVAPFASPAVTESKESVLVPASPGVRRFARELGVSLALVTGSGNKGRILKKDVQEYIKSRLSAKVEPAKKELPAVDFAQWGPIKSEPLNRIKRITGERMQLSWQTIPHVTQFDKADITELEAHRQSLNKNRKQGSSKVTILPFIMKAVTQLLIEFPDFNSSLGGDGSDLIQKQYYNIGVAVDTPGGLVVPTIKNVDKKLLTEISDELIDVSARARDKKINPDELVGGTFTISSLGSISGTYFTPIINLPEVAILGISRAAKEAVEIDGKIVLRLMLPYSVSYDHRVIDGAATARFTKRFNELLENFKEITGID
jgi:pyruvate dehydrogenase E2 component (dihydrolipoamide acetyltransferase)